MKTLSRTAVAATPMADLAFRALFSLIFLAAGLKHLVRPDDLIARLGEAPLSWMATAVGPPHVLMALTGVVLLGAGLGLLLGWWARASALALIAVLIPITIVVDLGHTENMGPLLKNIALLGGLIHFAARGPGAYAVDTRRRSLGRCPVETA